MLFTINGEKFEYRGKQSILGALHSLQYEKLQYDVFLKQLRRRLRIYTGKTEVAFYTEEKLADLLLELGVASLAKEGGKKTMEKILPQLLAAADLAERWNATLQAVNNRRNRHDDFPREAVRVQRGKTPLYLLEDVLAYEERRGLYK